MRIRPISFSSFRLPWECEEREREELSRRQTTVRQEDTGIRLRVSRALNETFLRSHESLFLNPTVRSNNLTSSTFSFEDDGIYSSRKLYVNSRLFESFKDKHSTPK